MAFIHFEPFPAALTWMLMRITLGCPVGAGHDELAEQAAFTRQTRSFSEISSFSGTRSSAS